MIGVILPYFLLVLGFALLIKGANFLVQGASIGAKKLGISDFMIGLTVVSFGTSMPELFVNVLGSINGANDLVFGNIIGSNIANILLVLGVMAIIAPIKIPHDLSWKDSFAFMGSIVLAGMMINIGGGTDVFILSRGEGLILLLMFGFFMFFAYSRNIEDEIETISNNEKRSKPILLFLGGIVGLAIGGNIVVDNAISISTSLGISERFIGISILAVGTSLPELVTSVVAVLNKRGDMGLGNIIGSNVFNVLFVLAVTAIISPVVVSDSVNFSLITNIIVHLVILYFIVSNTKKIDRVWGWVFVVFYILFIYYSLSL